MTERELMDELVKAAMNMDAAISNLYAGTYEFSPSEEIVDLGTLIEHVREHLWASEAALDKLKEAHKELEFWLKEGAKGADEEDE